MLPASGEFAYDVIEATAASGVLALADADDKMLALDHFSLGCLAVTLGPRSTSIKYYLCRVADRLQLDRS